MTDTITLTADAPRSLRTLGDRGQCHALCNCDHVSAPHLFSALIAAVFHFKSSLGLLALGQRQPGAGAAVCL